MRELVTALTRAMITARTEGRDDDVDAHQPRPVRAAHN